MQNVTRRVLQRQIPRCFCVVSAGPPSKLYSTESDSKPASQQHYKWRKEWKDVEGYKASKFALWSSGNRSSNFIKTMQQLDLSPDGIMDWFKNKKESKEEFKQRYVAERHQFLGPNLASAHFIVFRGGSVRFEGGTIWVKKDEDDEYDLPSQKVEGMALEAIDASNLDLRYGALKNLVNLDKLKWISFANNKYVDDWFLDAVCGEMSKLEYLDISGCKNITHMGLNVLSRLPNLKIVNVQDASTDTVEFRLACLSLEEWNPRLEVKGLDHNVPVKQIQKVVSEQQQG